VSMTNGVAATLALDALPIGAQVVACGIDDDGTAFGRLYEHQQLANGTRYWKDTTYPAGVALLSCLLVDQYDDMVITRLPVPESPDLSTGEKP
jgi:hypothetical protein